MARTGGKDSILKKGNGMEQFLAEEVQCKLAANDVDRVTGKVFFTSRADITEVAALKSAERLFLLLRRAPPISQTGEAGKVEDVIRDQIIGPLQRWTEGLSLWRRLRKVLERTEPNPKGAGQGRKRKLELEVGDEERPVCGGPGLLEGRGPEEKRQGLGLKGCGSGVEGRGSGTERRDSGVEPAVTGPSRVEAPPPSGSSTEEGGVSEAQSTPVSFRVCCRSSGTVARMFHCQDLGRVVGVAISKRLGWTVNLREPDLEVSVHLTNDHCVLGLPLLRLPLANRSYIKTTGLRSTVAWSMASLAEIQPGSRVLDPMCGVGAILLEAAKECPNSFFLGMDIDELQLAKARDNVQFAELTEKVEVMKSSVMAIPVPSNSVDAVVCDIPFGRKFGNKSDMAACLPAIVKEMERVLRVGGALVLLLSPALATVLKRSLRPQPVTPGESPPQRPGDPPSLPFPSLELQSSHRVSLGLSDALIHKYRKGSSVV